MARIGVVVGVVGSQDIFASPFEKSKLRNSVRRTLGLTDDAACYKTITRPRSIIVRDVAFSCGVILKFAIKYLRF